MANYKNAYLTKQPNSVNPSEWINKQEQIGLQYDAIKNQKKQQELARQDKLRKEFNNDFEGEFDLSSFNNESVNRVFEPMARQSIVDLKEAKDQGEKALNQYGINSKEYRTARDKYDNILKRPKMFRLAFEQTASKLNGFNDLVSSGKAHQIPENIEKLQKLTSEPIKYRQDTNGKYILMQGDNAYTMDEFADKLDLGRVVPVIDENSVIEGITSAIGKKEYDQRVGYETTTVTNPWDNTKDGKLGIKSFLTKGYENALTDEVMESVLAGRGEFGYNEMSDSTKEELKANVINEWLEVGRGQIEEKLGVDFDSSRYNQDARLANDRKKNKPQITEITEPTKDTFPHYKSISNGNAIGVSGAKTISSIKTETWSNGEPEYIDGNKNPKWEGNKGETLSNVKPLAFTMDDKGRLIASVSFSDGVKMTQNQIEKLKDDLDYYKEEGTEDKRVEELEETIKKAEKGVKNVIKDVVVAKDREFEFADAAGVSVEELKNNLKDKKTDNASPKTAADIFK